MTDTLVFVSGGSSGIGRALIEALPFDDARVVNFARRPAPRSDHVEVDLATLPGIERAARGFADELKGFSGNAVYFIHCAGVLTPIGFVGESDAALYAHNVMLNSVAPQILGDAFFRALPATGPSATMLNIGSGAARFSIPGWTGYCAGKAAADHWVRTAGQELAMRERPHKVISVSPGIVETAMQQEIRATPGEDFPQLPRFVEIYERGENREPERVARDLWKLLLSEPENGAVLELYE